MSDVIRISRNAPADTNYADDVGLVVYESGDDECALATSGAVRPLGVIESAENADAGRVVIVIHGIAKAIAGATIADGSPLVKATAGGKITTSTTTFQANSTFEWAVGSMVLRNGVSTVSGGVYDIMVAPTLNAVGGTT